jgi:hypothetical protein
MKSVITAFLTVNPAPHKIQIYNLACALGVSKRVLAETMLEMISEQSIPETLDILPDTDTTDVLESIDSDDIPTDDLLLNDGTTDETHNEALKHATRNDGTLEENTDNQLLMNDVPTPISASNKDSILGKMDPVMDSLMHALAGLQHVKSDIIIFDGNLNKQVMGAVQLLKDAHTEVQDIMESIEEA